MSTLSSSYIANVFLSNGGPRSIPSIGQTPVVSGNPQTQNSGPNSSQPSRGADRVTLSPGAREIAAQNSSQGTPSDNNTSTRQPRVDPGLYSPGQNAQNSELHLDEQQVRELQKLKQRDAEVRRHEHAHLAVAGRYAAGGASFTYQKGPDGRNYAVAGEVPIDMGKEDTPEETILKMQTIKRAALAPAQPSSADRMIASQADAKAAQARQELQSEKMRETQDAVSNSLGALPEPSSPTLIIDENNNQNPNQLQPTQSINAVSRRTFQMISAYDAATSVS